MAKKTVLVATILASFLAIGATPVRAQHRHRDGFHGRIEASRLEVLSHRLEGSVQHVQRAAERRIDDPSRRERKALRALHVLAKRADRFHARAARHPRAVRHLTADFWALDESFRVAEARMHRVHAPHLRRHLGRIGVLVQQLERELERSVRLARHHRSRQVRGRARHSSYGAFAWRW